MTTINPLIPTIPGITGVLGAISATAAYANITATGQTKELAAVANAPQVATATANFKAAVSKMTTVQQLLNNPQALQYLMTAYGLGDDTSQMGIIKQVLTQDPTASNSLVNQLAAPQWKTMAEALQTYSTGLSTLKGSVITQTFGLQAYSGQYFQVQKSNTTTYGVGSTASSITSTQNLYANSLSGLTVSAGGILQTTDGYNVMGLKLDNNGNVQTPAGANLVDYTTSVQDDTGTNQTVNESFSNQGNGNWQWTVTDTSGNILSQQTLAVTFNPDGTLNTVNGASGTAATTQSTTLNWSDGGTTSQPFDLSQAFTAGFNQYTTAGDLRAVQVNWFDTAAGSTTTPTSPSTTITPYANLSSTQPVDSSTNYSSVISVQDDNNNAAAVTQTLNQNSDGTWDWTITGSDGTTLYNQSNLNLKFNSNGSLESVNNNTNTSPSVTLNWADGGTTSQSFDLSSVFQRSDFSQSASVTDNIGTVHNVTLDYTKTNAASNSWQVEVWDADTNTLAQTVDLTFNANGTVSSVGTVDPTTGQIVNTDGNPAATSTNVSINWGSGYGSSTLNLDLSNLTSVGSTNVEDQPTATGSVALGTRQSVAIDQNGTVSATYEKADNSGTITIPLYRLAVNTFTNPSGGLNSYNATSYFTANSNAGTDTIQPLGTDTDASGNLVAGEAGQLAAKPTETDSKNMMDTITSGYDNYVYQEALGQENEALRYAVYFKQNAANITTIDGLLGDGPSRDLVSTVFGIPQQVATQDINTQEQIFSSHVDVSKFQNTDYVNNLIQRFLAVSDANNPTGSSTASSPLLSLISTSPSTDGGASTISSLLSTVTSNINILA